MSSAPAPVPSSASDMARKLKWYARTEASIRVNTTWNASVHAVTNPRASNTRVDGVPAAPAAPMDSRSQCLSSPPALSTNP